MPERRTSIDDEDMNDNAGSDTGSNTGSNTGSDIDFKNGSERTAQCIRSVANFSKLKTFHNIEKGEFNGDMLNLWMKEASPKLEALFNYIAKLDEEDKTNYGKHFKHIIFTDSKTSNYGAKLLASAFVAKGFHIAFKVQGRGFALNAKETMVETKGKNFGLLMSKNFFERPMNVKFRKQQLDLFNHRPDNVHGDLMRFIILDQGFKEGIDLYDVKYVHLFEPLVVSADEKQAIGRGTRFCGQKSLNFHPHYGWPLYVFKYNVRIPDELRKTFLDSATIHDLYLKYAAIDLRKVIFAAELEQATKEAAVDATLTSPVHNFRVQKPPHGKAHHGGAVTTRGSIPAPPSRTMAFNEMQSFVSRRFKKYKYAEPKMENQCKNDAKQGPVVGEIADLTPTQGFVSNFFTVKSAYKGMLLWHTVGSGKTCTAIATATSSFEQAGYTILWVTRHTLKNDIWKNMFGLVCSSTLQEKLKDGSLKLPAKVTGPMRYLSKNWMNPISYKQFSNLLLKKNKIYEDMVKRNGAKDPLYKTLIIIDEAHKVYSPTVAAAEKPNTDILEKMVQNSYSVSGPNSVRILAMTGTPYTEDSMEMIQLLNLLRVKDQLPTSFEAFAKVYLNENGYFTKSGKKKFQDAVSGYISHLDRTEDARMFAYPVMQDVLVPMSQTPAKPRIDPKTGKPVKKKTVNPVLENVKALQYDMMDLVHQLKVDTKNAQDECKEDLKNKHDRDIAEAKASKKDKDTMQRLRDLKKSALETCKYTSHENVTKHLSQDYYRVLKEMGKMQSQIQELMEVLIDNKWKKKDYTKQIKEWREELKDIRGQMNDVKSGLSKRQKDIGKGADKERNKAALKELKESAGVRVTELKARMQKIRSNIVKNQLSKKFILLSEGKGSIGDVSQESALKKRCGV